MKLLTVSVAAYNVAQYLDRLIQSLINSQILEQLEVLIINDGSTDSTAEIALAYQKRFPDSVRLINKENGGHGSTINRGIQEAHGKYFRVLDGDDWIHPDHLKALVEKLADIHVDMILSEYCSCYEDGTEIVSSDYSQLEDGHTYTFDELHAKIEWMCLHTAIYRTELLQKHHIPLDEHCFYVDTEFMLFPIPYVETVYYSKDYVYCYRLGLPGQSVSKQGRIKHIADGDRVSKSLLTYYSSIKLQLSESKNQYFITGIARHCLFHFKSLMILQANKENKKRILAFEKQVKKAEPKVYAMMGKLGRRSRMLNSLRSYHYLNYRIMNWYKNRFSPIT